VEEGRGGGETNKQGGTPQNPQKKKQRGGGGEKKTQGGVPQGGGGQGGQTKPLFVFFVTGFFSLVGGGPWGNSGGAEGQGGAPQNTWGGRGGELLGGVPADSVGDQPKGAGYESRAQSTPPKHGEGVGGSRGCRVGK